MSKVIIVSKTHLDLGFTALAGEILNQYVNDFIPKAISISQEVNKDGKKFVWTVGSWLLKEALIRGTDIQKKKLYDAAKRGDIIAHGYPFTTHTELLDKDTLEYGMSIVKRLDNEFGRNTISAKMTDVPGHTIGLVPILAKAGIKLIHIGVNGASAMPNVPDCFLWKNGDSEVVVVYSGGYGGEHKSKVIDDILYLDHSLDNHGPRDAKGVLDNFNHIKSKYPGFDVVAGSLDDYAELLWNAKDKLPVVTSEIGDTWIHGASTDPYKVGAMRTLMSLKNKWLEDGSLLRDSHEYVQLCDNIMCVSEHTWGLDSKGSYGDYYNYLRKDFDEARAKDIKIKRGAFFNLPFCKKLRVQGKQGVYSKIEKGWQEQREYIDKAVSGLSEDHKGVATKEIERLIPNEQWQHFSSKSEANSTYQYGDFVISINSFGGIGSFTENGECIISKNDKPLLEYKSYGQNNYDYWVKHYTRDILHTRFWALADFARPKLKRVDKKFPQGIFSYKMSSCSFNKDNSGITIIANLTIDDKCFSELGAPKSAQIKYYVTNQGLNIYFQWFKKPANRLTESLSLRLYPNFDKNSLRYVKLGSEINPMDVVENGNRKMSAVEECTFTVKNTEYVLTNYHSPLIGLGSTDILHFDNQFVNYQEDGISYILHNNVWGTNFPLWYGENAYFEYVIKKA